MRTGMIIGVDVDDFRLPPKDALNRAAELKFHSVEFAAVSGDLAPKNLSPSGRRHLGRLVEGLGLRLTAITADFAGLRLTDPKAVEERVERTCEILELGRGLQVATITAAVGALTHPETQEPSPIALQALQRIGEFADSRGITYAIRPSHDGAERLLRVLDELRCPAIKVALDPAALIMAGANPLAVAERLGDRIALVHARDGTAGGAERSGREAAMGEGDVDWPGLLHSLRDADYASAYILRRTDSQSPARDLQSARDFLQAHGGS